MSNRTISRDILSGLIVGLAGSLVNLFPLDLFPGFSLVFGSALVISVASRRGALAGGVAGITAGSVFWWSTPILSHLYAFLLCGEAIWVGFLFSRRRWRPLYLTLAFWLLIGCWVEILFVRYGLKIQGLAPALIALRLVINGLVNALIAEFLLICLSFINYRRGETEGLFRLGLSSTVSLVLMIATSFTAIYGIAGNAKAERAKLMELVQIESTLGAGSVQRGIGEWLYSTSRSLTYVADIISLERIPYADSARLNSLLEALRDHEVELAGLFIIDLNGRTAGYSLVGFSDPAKLVGLDYSSKPYFQKLRETDGPVFISVAKTNNGFTLASALVAVPIRDASGRRTGSVVAWYKNQIFKDLARRISDERDLGRVRVVDANAQLVVDSTSDGIRGDSADLQNDKGYKLALQSADGRNTLDAELSSRLAPAEALTGEHGSWIAWSTVPDLGWKVLIERPMEPVQQKLVTYNLTLLSELLGFMLLAVIVAHAVGSRLSKPLVELERYALRLASGDLSARPETTFVITREANLLRRAFARMAEALEDSWREQRAITENAETAAREAQARAGHVAALNELGQELSLTFDLQNICRAANRYIHTQVEASSFVISLYDEAEEVIQPTYAWSDGTEPDTSEFPAIKLGHGAHSQCIRSKSPVLIEDIAATRPFGTMYIVPTDTGTRVPQSILYLPLISFDRVVGTLQVQSYKTGQFQASDIDRLVSVANQIAVSISNATLFDQIKHAKAEWEKTFDSMSDGVFLFSENAELIRVNRAGAEMEGKPLHTLLGSSCCTLLSDGSNGECFVEAAISKGERLVRELVSRTRDRTLLVTVEPVDVDGRARGSICVARDITKLRKAEAEARAQREFAAQLVENAQEAIFTFDRRGHVTWFNRQFCDTTGFSTAEVDHRDIRSLVYKDDVAKVGDCVARVFEGYNDSYEARFVRKDGEIRWFKTTFTAVKSNDAITSVLAITRDITDEHDAAEQMQRANKLAAVGQLAAGVAHDFNNLLVPILGRAQLLKRQLKDQNAQRGLDVIEKAALDGAATVRRLQNFARRRSEEEMEPVDIDELMRDVVELTRTRWRDDAMSRGIKYEISLNFGEGSLVIGSPSELREVFTNIVINALDAMPDGGRLSLRSHIEGERVRLTFSDTGTGMSEDVMSRIFEPFFSTKGHAGTGLGLAVSYGIIERHTGTIEVNSTPGAGTTFNIFLPLTTSCVAPTLAPQPQFQPSKIRILVVDDEDMVRQTLVDILESLGYEVVAAEGGSAGLKHLDEKAADIVLTDLSMPEMDGWTFARNVKARHPDTPVVLVTGYGLSIELSGERSGLINEVICKPYDFNEIAQTVERLAGKAPLELVR